MIYAPATIAPRTIIYTIPIPTFNPDTNTIPNTNPKLNLTLDCNPNPEPVLWSTGNESWSKCCRGNRQINRISSDFLTV